MPICAYKSIELFRAPKWLRENTSTVALLEVFIPSSTESPPAVLIWGGPTPMYSWALPSFEVESLRNQKLQRTPGTYTYYRPATSIFSPPWPATAYDIGLVTTATDPLSINNPHSFEKLEPDLGQKFSSQFWACVFVWAWFSSDTDKTHFV
jgi:hypothetical protein